MVVMVEQDGQVIANDQNMSDFHCNQFLVVVDHCEDYDGSEKSGSNCYC